METLQMIASYPVLGFPAIMYGGVFVLVLTLVTATMGGLIYSGKNIPMVYHRLLAAVTVVAVLVHGLLAMSLFL